MPQQLVRCGDVWQQVAMEHIVPIMMLALTLAGVIALPGPGLRLATMVAVTVLSLILLSPTPYDPGAGYGIGLAILVFSLLQLCAVAGVALLFLRVTGLVGPGWVRTMAVDPWLAGFAMLPVAVWLALMLGEALAGNRAPLATHLGLLGACVLVAVFALLRLRGIPRGAALDLALAFAAICVTSMRLEAQIMAALPGPATKNPACLSFGGNAAPARPLMGLTTAKPLLLLGEQDGQIVTWRWSFRGMYFSRAGGSHPLPCQPVAGGLVLP